MPNTARQNRFDALTAQQVSNLGSIGAVRHQLASAFQSARQRGSKRGPLIGHSIIQNRLSQIPDCLNADFERAPVKLGLSQPVGRSMWMQAASHGGRHARYELPDGDLIVLDCDVLIRSALYLYFGALGKGELDGRVAQAFTLTYAAILPGSAIPFQDQILIQILNHTNSRALFLECLNTLLDFVALHEAGHVYCDRSGRSHAFFRVEMSDHDDSADRSNGVRYHAFYRDPWQAGETIKLGSAISRAQCDELFCDAFALVSRSIMDASGTFTLPVLDALTLRLLALSGFFLLEDMSNVHGPGPTASVNIGRLKMANRNVPPNQPLEQQPGYNKTHPSPLERFTSSYIHAGWICKDAGVDRDPLCPDGDDTLFAQVQASWRNETRLFMDITIDGIRNTSSQPYAHLAEQVDTLCDHLEIEKPHTSGALKALALVALVPHFRQMLRQDDHLDKQTAMVLDRLAEKNAFDRLPDNCALGVLIQRLCLVLSDPLKTMDMLQASQGNSAEV